MYGLLSSCNCRYCFTDYTRSCRKQAILDGNVYIVVDMELKGLIREALIKMILGFDIALEIEEE